MSDQALLNRRRRIQATLSIRPAWFVPLLNQERLDRQAFSQKVDSLRERFDAWDTLTTRHIEMLEQTVPAMWKRASGLLTSAKTSAESAKALAEQAEDIAFDMAKEAAVAAERLAMPSLRARVLWLLTGKA